MERRNECIEMLKEIKNSLEEVVNINATFIGGISCDSAKFVIDQAISILENENPNKMYKTLADVSYERGLKDAWECAKKIAVDMTVENLKSCGLCTNNDEYESEEYEYSCEVINKYSVSEAIAKIKEYEERKKQAEEIKVGDEVVYNNITTIVVTYIDKDDCIEGLDFNGESFCYDYTTNVLKNLKKTGRTFPQITEMLEKMKGCTE